MATSRYSNTDIKDFYLDIWEAKTITPSIDDEVYVIPPAYNERPDLLSDLKYGTVKYWWVFAMRNQDVLVNPINDFVAGTTIFIPPKSSL